jgi:hypothetical protein
VDARNATVAVGPCSFLPAEGVGNANTFALAKTCHRGPLGALGQRTNPIGGINPREVRDSDRQEGCACFGEGQDSGAAIQSTAPKVSDRRGINPSPQEEFLGRDKSSTVFWGHFSAPFPFT